MLSYQHLTDAELIHYAQLEPAESLGAIMATRYNDNITHVASLEELHASMIEDFERTQAVKISELNDQLNEMAKRISTLEKQLAAVDRVLLK